MIILILLLVASCSKESSLFMPNKDKIKFIPNYLANNSDSDSDDDNEDYVDEIEEEEEINEEDINLFQLVEQKRIDILLPYIAYTNNLNILEKVDENNNTFLHIFINQIEDADSRSENDLINLIEYLKNKDNFDWNKIGQSGSYAFLALKNNLFFTLASIIENNFNISNEDLSLYIDLMIEKEYHFSNECLRLFLSSLSSKQLNEVKVLLKTKLIHYQNTKSKRVILSLLKNLGQEDKENSSENCIENNNLLMNHFTFH